MEGLPMLTCLIQHTLKGLCSCSSSHNTSTKWVYAVFWRILPRIYPPPKWDDHEGGVLDHAKGNKRNWILVWEDGFCDLDECERGGNGFLKGRFGAGIFFKLSHEVYNYGEGLIGKVAADYSHRWVFKDGSNENDPSFISSWNASIDPQPKAWDFHFNSGIKTIAIISVREGIIQLGSFDKILEDLNLVISIQRKFSYLRSIPGIFPIQRPFFTVQPPYNSLMHNPPMGSNQADKTRQLIGSKRVMVNIHGGDTRPHNDPIQPIHLGQQNGLIGSYVPPLWPIPPLLPPSFGKMPPYNDNNNGIVKSLDPTQIDNGITHCVGDRVMGPDEEGKPGCLNLNPELVVELGCGPKESDIKS